MRVTFLVAVAAVLVCVSLASLSPVAANKPPVYVFDFPPGWFKNSQESAGHNLQLINPVSPATLETSPVLVNPFAGQLPKMGRLVPVTNEDGLSPADVGTQIAGRHPGGVTHVQGGFPTARFAQVHPHILSHVDVRACAGCTYLD
jgi:hypothetical protein